MHTLPGGVFILVELEPFSLVSVISEETFEISSEIHKFIKAFQEKTRACDHQSFFPSEKIENRESKKFGICGRSDRLLLIFGRVGTKYYLYYSTYHLCQISCCGTSRFFGAHNHHELGGKAEKKCSKY